MRKRSLLLAIILASLGLPSLAGAGPAADSDNDGIPNSVDNCTLVANSDQRDTDGDGFGNLCDADLNNDCLVNVVDLGALRFAFFSQNGNSNWNPDADFDGNGVVNVADLGRLRFAFFTAPGPSGAPNLCTDNDEDGVPSLTDCDDDDPFTFPGAPERCDAVDNNCNLLTDEGIPNDGAGCRDPGPPVFPAIVDVLHIITQTGAGTNDGTDDNVLSVCLTANDCWELNNDNFNDFQRATYDVFSFEDIDLSRLAIDRVEIRSQNGSDAWTPSCVQINLDGEPVYCADPGVRFGNAAGEFSNWQDPAGLHLECQSCTAASLTHGPMVGAVGPDTAKLWARTDATRQLNLRVTESAAALAGAAPVAIRYPAASSDFTETVDVAGLKPNTEYFYTFETGGPTTAPNTFKTAPALGAPVTLSFAFGSCTFHDDQPIFDEINNLNPDLFLFVGDAHYGNTDELSDLRRYYQWGLDANPPNGIGRSSRASLVAHTPTIATWDDHDFTGNNSNGSAPGKAVALQGFTEYWANPGFGEPGVPGVYYSYRYGDVEFFVIDSRYYRDLTLPLDSLSLLGDDQTAWLQSALVNSSAVFKILVSGSQWTTEGSSDSWAAFPEAQRALFNYIAAKGIAGVVTLSGDVHRSELRFIPGGPGGYTVPELTSSPLANTNIDCATSNELEACEDSGNYFVFVNVNTTLADPTLSAQILDANRNVVSTLTVSASQLNNSPPAAVEPRALPDFNGDGYADLVIGIPGENIDGTNGGAFAALYGTTQGLHSFGNQLWHQDSPGISDTAETGDLFGAALASGDFNGDGYTDVVAGAPNEKIAPDNRQEAGAINVIYGSVAGLSAVGQQLLHKDNLGIGTIGPLAGDLFGYALAVGDFDGDMHDDLAVGAPMNGSGSFGGGQVFVFYGSPAGLQTAGLDIWDQFFTGDTSSNENGDAFGTALVAGNFNGDSYDDLAIGAPGEDLDANTNAGMVTVLYGSSGGLTAAGDQEWHQDTSGIAGAAENNDRFGAALASGDFNGDTYEDLLVGVPGEAIGSSTGAGMTNVIYGSATGLTSTGNQIWHLDSNGISEDVDFFDLLGTSVASADFNNDGFSDLAAGIPGRNATGASNAGAVLIINGSSAGLTSVGHRIWDQSLLPSVVTEQSDEFGSTLSIGDFNADGFTDLAVGTPGEDIGTISNAGIVNTLYGSADGLNATRAQRWHQDVAGIVGEAQSSDRLGSALPR